MLQRIKKAKLAVEVDTRASPKQGDEVVVGRVVIRRTTGFFEVNVASGEN